ncbi:hypothetical protein [Dactylosporangium sp. NPDC049140]|uniref:hypothetical protein n=1 Tax=Dactylosporangium sp. NPDC049140 TaxID=3155647 RepID=UPI00340797BE
MSGLYDLIAAWFTGKPTGTLELFGLKMAIWGRAGKSLLYLAGLAILLDLPDPTNLRNLGKASQDRARLKLDQSGHKRKIHRWLELQTTILADIVVTVPAPKVGPRVFKIETPPKAVSAGLTMPLTDYRDFHREAITALSAPHDCGEQHSKGRVCPQQYEATVNRVNRLIATQLPEHERHLIQEMKAAQNNFGAGFLGLAVLLAGAITAFAALKWGTPWLLVAYLAIGVSLIIVNPKLRLLTAALGYRALGAVQQGWGGLLDQTRPLHVLRKVAAVLFLVGGLLDLLAS